jgi:hypothetical protein
VVSSSSRYRIVPRLQPDFPIGRLLAFIDSTYNTAADSRGGDRTLLETPRPCLCMTLILSKPDEGLEAAHRGR